MTELKYKVWLITGASVGFGRALADEIIARGGCVIATARDRSAIVQLERSNPERVLSLPLDVTNSDQISVAIRAAEARFGRIDVLINNAGYGFLSSVEEASDVEIRAQFDVNFFGLAAVTREVLPIMRRQRSGYIVNISSIAGICGMSGSGYYSASKFAVEGLSEAMALELAPFGVGVLIVEPGAFRTEFSGRSLGQPKHPIADYQDAAALRVRLGKASGQQAGNPKLAATAIVNTVIGDAPPRRLVLGRAAFGFACKALEDRIRDTQKSQAIAENVDFVST